MRVKLKLQPVQALQFLLQSDEMHVNASDGQIKEIVKRNFGHVIGNIHKYPGYSDLNYRIETIKERGADNKVTGAGRMMVLKVLNSDDSKYPECFGEYLLCYMKIYFFVA